MNPWFRMSALAVLLSFSGSLYAKNNKVYRPSTKIQYTAEQLAAEKTRREGILNRTNNVMSLLAAEMAFNQGDFQTALGMYLSALRENKAPELAERAMELAMEMRAYPIAEAVYQQWRQIEPNPSPAQRRLALIRALALGDATISLPMIDSVMKEANDMERMRLFLQIAQMGIVHDDLLQKGGKTVHQAAQSYQHLASANIADAIYSMGDKQEKQVIKALTLLAKNDPELSQSSQLLLEMIAQRQPEYLNRFFAQKHTHFSANWLVLAIQSMIQMKRYDEAKSAIDNLIEQNPKANIYFQAAVLTHKMDNKNANIARYLEKAYQSGNQEDKTRAALMLALQYLGNDQYNLAQEWANKMQSAAYQYDKAVLLANIASQKQQWQEATKWLKQAEKTPSQRAGTYFGQYDYWRTKLYVLSQTQKPEQVLAVMEKALKEAKKLSDEEERDNLISQIIYQRGLLYADKVRNIPAAIADLRQFVQLNPENPLGLNALGYTMLSGSPKDYDEALKFIQAAYQQESDNPQFRDSLGWAYHKKGNNQAALPHLEFAYEHEKDPEVAAHLGEVYWLLNRPDDAKRVWREGWQKNAQHHVLKETLKRYQIVF